MITVTRPTPLAHEVKTVRAQFKALDDGPAGMFEAIVAVFGNVDYGYDRIVKGAFTRTLEEWRSDGDPIPVIWSHMWDDPEAHIGWADPKDVVETDAGLYVKRATLDVANNGKAEYVARLMKDRRVREFSFGYYAVKTAWVQEEGHPYEIRELLDMDLFEIGPTLKGMNPDTQLLGAASRLRKTAVLEDAPAATDPGEGDGTAPQADPPGDGPTDTETDPGSRDTSPTIDPEKVADLLGRTRHTEE